MLHVTENTVNPTPATRERLSAPDFAAGAENLARGAASFAQSLGQATENLDKIGETYDTAAVKQADAEDLRHIAEIRGQVMSSKGFDSQTAIADARQQIDEIRKGRMASLHNSRQRNMYADIFDQRSLQLEESFATHSATEIASANQAASVARAETYSDLATDTFGTKAFETNLGTALNEVAAANSGQAADVIARRQATVKSTIISKAIGGMIADPDQADHAQLALAQHAKDILPDDEEKLHKQLNPILQENRTDADAGWAFTNAPKPGSPVEGATASGQVEQGNIDLHHRAIARNKDGSISTVLSMSIGTDKGEVLIPKVIDGHVVSEKEAIAHYRKTGEHLGVFKDEASATAYAQSLHQEQAREYAPTSPADPLRGKGRITNTAAQHRARGSGNALDIAAPAGTPIYTPMSGKVVKSWWDQKGGWSVLVEHPNGYVTGYAHLRSKSPYAEGQAVDGDTPIGSVGATGDATGPHVHYTVRQSRGGPRVDPSAALWGQGSVKPGSVAWREAEPQKYNADNNGLDRALSRLHDRAAAENWSPNRYNKAVDRVRQISGVQEQLYNQQQEDRYDSAVSTVVGLGDKFTSISQIPGFGLLKPTQQYSLQQIAEGNKTGKALPANGPRFLMLMGMAQSPEYRQQFLSVDLAQEKDVTPGERERLWGTQLKLKQEPNGALAANFNTVEQYANRYLPTSTYKGEEGAKKRRAFSDRMGGAIERQQNELGRPLTSRETDDIARSLTVQVVRPGGDTSLGFEVMGTGQGGAVNIPQTYEAIAPDIRQRLVDELARQGKPHSMKDVVEVWLQSRSR